MNFDIDDLLSKERITHRELETIKNELQAAIGELYYTNRMLMLLMMLNFLNF